MVLHTYTVSCTFFSACNIHCVIILSNISYDCISLSNNGTDALFSNVMIVLTISASSNIGSRIFMYLAIDRGSSHWRRRATGRYIVWYKPSTLSHLISIHAKRWSENPVNCVYPSLSTSSVEVPNIPSIVLVPGVRVGGGYKCACLDRISSFYSIDSKVCLKVPFLSLDKSTFASIMTNS